MWLFVVEKYKRTIWLRTCCTIIREKAKQVDVVVTVLTCVRGGGSPFLVSTELSATPNSALSCFSSVSPDNVG